MKNNRFVSLLKTDSNLPTPSSSRYLRILARYSCAIAAEIYACCDGCSMAWQSRRIELDLVRSRGLSKTALMTADCHILSRQENLFIQRVGYKLPDSVAYFPTFQDLFDVQVEVSRHIASCATSARLAPRWALCELASACLNCTPLGSSLAVVSDCRLLSSQFQSGPAFRPLETERV